MPFFKGLYTFADNRVVVYHKAMSLLNESSTNLGLYTLATAPDFVNMSDNS